MPGTSNEIAPRFAQIAVDNVDVAIAVVVPRGAALLVQYVNRGFERIFGWGADEILDEPITLLGAEADWRTHLMGTSVGSGPTHKVESALRTKSGTDVLVCVEIHAVDLGGLAAGVLVMSDVTEQRRLEHIAAASVMSESVGHLFAGIRHELANPLNSLKAALTLLADPTMQLALDRRAEFLGRALAEIRRMETLLDQLRTFNRAETVVLDRLELRPFLERLVRIAADDCVALGATIELEPGDDAAVVADARCSSRRCSSFSRTRSTRCGRGAFAASRSAA